VSTGVGTVKIATPFTPGDSYLWDGAAVLRPHQRMMLGRGFQSRENAVSNATVATMGIDIGKNSVPHYQPRFARRNRAAAEVSRGQIEARLANLPPCLIGMEACVGAHHLSRRLESQGHDARLMRCQPNTSAHIPKDKK
jgi:hypothetical protein